MLQGMPDGLLSEGSDPAGPQKEGWDTFDGLVALMSRPCLSHSMARCPGTTWLHVAMAEPWQKGVGPV